MSIHQKIQKLKEEYIRRSTENQASAYAYALMGSVGVAPEQLKSYEESVAKIGKKN